MSVESNKIQTIIKRAAGERDISEDCTVMVTNANEVLANDSIHGKIGNVGVGFGTGRNTAYAIKKKS